MKEKVKTWFSMLWRKRRSFLGAGRVEKQLEKINSRIDALSDLLYFHEKFFHKEDVSLSRLVQEEAWGGLHGYRYVMHHLPEKWYETRVPDWEEILKNTSNVNSVFEFGTNIGANLEAIRHINPNVTIDGIEINPLAVRICRERGFKNVNQDSIISYEPNKRYDLVFSRGVLIHIPPQHIKNVLTSMYSSSCRYILIWENFSSKPYHLEKYSKKVKDSYSLKDSEGFQFWMDFAGEFAKLYTGIKVVAKSKNSLSAKQGELVWTLFEK